MLFLPLCTRSARSDQNSLNFFLLPAQMHDLPVPMHEQGEPGQARPPGAQEGAAVRLPGLPEAVRAKGPPQRGEGMNYFIFLTPFTSISPFMSAIGIIIS